MPTARIDLDDLQAVLAAGPPGRRSSACRPATSTPGRATICAPRSGSPAQQGGWVHVDGAFGLWAAASPTTAHLVDGVELADSWAHRRAQVAQRPLRLGVRLLRRTRRPRRRRVLHRLPIWSARAACLSVRLRPRVVAAGHGVSLPGPRCGSSGRTASPTWSTAAARWPAGSPTGSRAGGAKVVNDVVLNQVLVGFGDDDRTDAIIDAVQRDGHLLAGRHDLARPAADADLGVELLDHRARTSTCRWRRSCG